VVGALLTLASRVGAFAIGYATTGIQIAGIAVDGIWILLASIFMWRDPTLALPQGGLVRAEIAELPALSVHADANELVEWAAGSATPPRVVYTVHGEPAAAAALCSALADRLDRPVVAPRYLERVAIRRA
jgi:Zn-dependent metallo-hydrolase RNA specificity domain